MQEHLGVQIVQKSLLCVDYPVEFKLLKLLNGVL
jgi:hypothetical protein